MKTNFSGCFWALSAATMLTLAGCGGGGGSGATASTTTPVTYSVVDGPIKGAMVCVDANKNGVCDASETQGTTDSTGKVTINVPNADVNQYPIVAVVPKGAVDMDDAANPIAVGFTLKAPAENQKVLSPLTNLVQHLVESGQTPADALKLIQENTGIKDPLANFVATPDSQAQTLAKTIVILTQAKTTELAGSTSSTVSQSDIDKAIRENINTNLTSITQEVATKADAGQPCATPASAECKTALNASVKDTLKDKVELSPTNIAAVVAVAKTPVDSGTSATNEPVANLRQLDYTDSNNWYYRAFVSTAAENTPDANGLVKYRELRVKNVNGTQTVIGGVLTSNNTRNDDIHWNGTNWVNNCDKDFQHTSTQRDANGISTYNYCDGFEKGNSQRLVAGIAGQTIAEATQNLRQYPGYGNWGNTASGTLNSVFNSTVKYPEGSQFYYQKTTATERAMTYVVANILEQYAADVAAGGDAVADSTIPCNAQNILSSQSTNLDAMIELNKGKPCKFGKSTITGANNASFNSGDRNEWWGNSTINLYDVCLQSNCYQTVSNASSAPAFYTGLTRIRAAFTGNTTNKEVTYYFCQQRYNGSPRNCNAVGTGTYAITTLGNARVLTFQNLPTLASSVTYQRIFVERENKIHYGYQDNLYTNVSARLNITATNALFGVLGIPAITP